MTGGRLEYYIFRGAFPNAKKKAIIQKENEFIRFQDCYHVYTMGNTTFHCLVVKPSQSTGILLYFHSNSTVLGSPILQYAKCLAKQLSKTVVAVEYPGYGLSTEECTMDNFFRVVEAATNFFQTGSYEGMPLVLYGKSLGCVAVCYLASMIRSIRGIILECAFVSIRDILGWTSLFVSKSMKKKMDRFSCVKYLSKVTCPKCLIYGTHDQFCPLRSQKQLFSYFEDISKDMILELHGFYHNNIPYGSKKCHCLLSFPYPCMCCIIAPAVSNAEDEFFSTLVSFMVMVDSSTLSQQSLLPFVVNDELNLESRKATTFMPNKDISSIRNQDSISIPSKDSTSTLHREELLQSGEMIPSTSR